MRKTGIAVVWLLAGVLAGCGSGSGDPQAANGTDGPADASTSTTTSTTTSSPSPTPAKPAKHAIIGTLLIRDLPDGYGWACGRSFDVTEGVGSAGYNNVSKLVDGWSIPCPDGLGGGFSDLQNGTDVTVKDGDGTILGVGHLRHGRLDTHKDAQWFGTSFTFRVPGIREGSDFYQVEVSHRGPITFPGKKLARKGWVVTLTIGN